PGERRLHARPCRPPTARRRRVPGAPPHSSRRERGPGQGRDVTSKKSPFALRDEHREQRQRIVGRETEVMAARVDRLVASYSPLGAALVQEVDELVAMRIFELPP